jgi:Tol biopolymer transport system component
MRRCNRVVLAALTVLLVAGAAAAGTPTAAPVAGKIVFSRADARGTYSLWTIAPAARALQRVTQGCGWDWFPAWSPDGRRIAFARACSRSQPGGDLDLYVVGADGTGLRRLVHTRTNEEWPTWSPDGSKIAFVSGEPQWVKPGQRGDAAAELWVVGANGRGLKRLTRNAVRDAAPAWSPDGRSIAFTSNRGGRNGIWIVPARGGTAQALRLAGGEPAWSPDGTQLAFAHRRPGLSRETVDLYVADADGSGIRCLTHEPVGVVSHHPSWSPDGRSIVYTSNRGGAHPSLWVIGANGQNTRQLTRAPMEDADPDWYRPA